MRKVPREVRNHARYPVDGAESLFTGRPPPPEGIDSLYYRASARTWGYASFLPSPCSSWRIEGASVVVSSACIWGMISLLERGGDDPEETINRANEPRVSRDMVIIIS